MSDAYRPEFASPAPPPRRHGLVALAVLLAFAAGLAVAWWGITRWEHRMGRAATAPATARPVAGPAAPSPAAPQLAPSIAADPTTLSTREDLLAARLATIEARTAIVAGDADAAAGQAGRAEALLLAAAARRAVDRGMGLGTLEGPLRARFAASQPRATQLVLQASHSPLTLETLRASFDALAPDLVGGGRDWWRGLRQTLATLVVIHREGEPSPVPADRIARARRLLAEGQVEAAAAEVAMLPGAAAAGNWLAAARRFGDTQRALDRLETTAILGQAEPAAAPAP